MIRLFILGALSLLLQVGQPAADRLSLYHYSVTCYDKKGAHTFDFFSPDPLTIDKPAFCAAKGMYAQGQRFGSRFRR